jgi:hypothetical protein
VDIADVKKELSSDEKLLESAFKVETLYKKYKKIIWGVSAGVVILFAGTQISQSLHEAKLSRANEALLTLQQNPQATQALEQLKEDNPALYTLYQFSQAVKKEDKEALKALSSNSNSIISDASGYTLSVLEKAPKDSTLYREFSLFERAYLALEAKNPTEAKRLLAEIPQESPLAMVTQLLKHATLKDK